MICPKCNAELPENVGAFCPMCGEKLPTAPAPEQPVMQAEPVQPAPVQAAPVPPTSFPANKVCPRCGAVAPADANVCPMCGQIFGVAPGFVPNAIPGDPSKNGFATAALVMGILSIFCCGGIAGILALIFGIIGRNSQKKGMAIAGLVLGIISIVFLVLYIVLTVLGIINIDMNELEYYFR